MATELNYEVCPETGIGCVLVRRNGDLTKLDLMPDEVGELERLAAAGDVAGIRTLLASVSSAAASLDDETLETLMQHAS